MLLTEYGSNVKTKSQVDDIAVRTWPIITFILYKVQITRYIVTIRRVLQKTNINVITMHVVITLLYNYILTPNEA